MGKREEERRRGIEADERKRKGKKRRRRRRELDYLKNLSSKKIERKFIKIRTGF